MINLNQKIYGYRRDNNRVGIRNHVIILPVDDISNAACEAVANNINMINFDKSAIFFDIKILLNESLNYVISIYVQRFKCCFNYSI